MQHSSKERGLNLWSGAEGGPKAKKAVGTATHHHAWVIRCWGLNPGLSAARAIPQPRSTAGTNCWI